MVLFFAFLLFFLCLYFVRGKVVQNRFIFIFRAFFPSWKFFEDATAQYKLFYQEDNLNWKPAIDLISRRELSLFLNHQVNFYLALDTMVQRLVMDAMESSFQEEHSVSYELVQRLVEKKIMSKKYRFKISDGINDILISREHVK